MNKLVPLSKFTKLDKKYFPQDTSIVVNKEGIPVGFVFGRDTFISFLEHIDEQFEDNVKDSKKAFHNPAGKLIDYIEEKLPIKPDFIKDLKMSVKNTKKTDLVSIDEIARVLHV